jgi:O-antigen ligase
MAEQCNWSLNISDSVLAFMGIGCFLAMGYANPNGRNGVIERSWTNLGCLLLLSLAALRLANVSVPILGNDVAGRALFVTANDAAFAPIFGLLCISRIAFRRGTLIAHATGHAAFAVLAASFAESRLVVIVSLVTAATLVAMAMRGDRALRRFASVAVLVALAGAGIGVVVNDRLSGKLRAGIDASLETRAYLLETALRLWGESPIIGRGPGAFELHYAQAHADFPPAREIDKRFVAWPHNAPVEVLLEKGLLGVGGLLAAAGWFFWRARLGATVPLQGKAVASDGVLVAALLFAALALVETSVHRIYFLTGVAAVVGTLFPCRLHNAESAGGN